MKNLLRYLILIFLSLPIPYKFLNAVYCPHCNDLREDCFEPREHGGGATGRWADTVTPKRGWTCIYAEDLGQGNTIECQMCEREQVRYLHHMRHGDQNPMYLEVGCICSGHMEGRFDDENSIAQAVRNAQRRTTNLQNRNTRRLAFPNLDGWQMSRNNNPYLRNYHGHHIVITSGRGKYSASVDGTYINQWVDTPDEAKLAAFDYLYPRRIQP